MFISVNLIERTKFFFQGETAAGKEIAKIIAEEEGAYHVSSLLLEIVGFCAKGRQQKRLFL